MKQNKWDIGWPMSPRLYTTIILLILFALVLFGCTSEHDDLMYLKEKHRDCEIILLNENKYYVVEDTNGFIYVYRSYVKLPNTIDYSTDPKIKIDENKN